MSRRERLAIGVAAPLAVAALAYALWWISDRLLVIGPFDRASFGWAVVVPLWAAVPVVAGRAWQRLARRETWIAASAVGGSVTLAAAVLLWLASAFPDCQFGATYTPADAILPAVLIGLVVGGSLVLGALAGRSLFRNEHPWLAVAGAAATELVALFLGITVVFGIVLATMGTFACQRPA